MARFSDQTLGIEETIGVGRGARPWWLQWWFWVVALVVAAAAAYWFLVPAPKTEYVTEDVVRTDIASQVDATGSLEPVDKVTVGAEISGKVDEVLVDYNDQVVTGQVIARINTDDLRARATQARATLASARANLLQSKASRSDAQRAFDRSKALREQGFASNATFENAEAALDRANAQVAASTAQVQQQEAALAQVETSLAKAEIKAPIDGVILERKIEPGQTVQASFQAPELFVIASDLSRLELQVYIDEADIARVKPDQPATFTVDAYESRKFDARVVAVRTAPRVQQNVVSYLATLSVDNGARLLRPGLTATAEITTATATQVLAVPNSALRFEPENAAKGDELSMQINPRGGARVGSGGGRDTGKAKQKNGSNKGQVWTVDKQGKPEKREVTTGITDGEKTEIKSGKIALGDKVITDIQTPGAKPKP